MLDSTGHRYCIRTDFRLQRCGSGIVTVQAVDNLLQQFGKYFICPLSLIAIFAGGLIIALSAFGTDDGSGSLGGYPFGIPLLAVGLVVLMLMLAVGPKHFEVSKSRYLAEAFFWSFL